MRHLIAAAAGAGIVIATACGGSGDSPPPTVGGITSTPTPPPTPGPPSPSVACDNGNGGITLPTGFCATVFADQVGTARHIAIASSGDVYVMLMGGAVLALRDTNADGHFDVRATFGRGGNSGLFVRGNDLYADNGAVIVRYKLTPGTLVPGAPDTIVRGLPTGGHIARHVTVDGSGNLFVNVGSASNTCEGSSRAGDCAELATRAGIFRFDANTVNQTFSASARFATGIRNANGLAIHPVTGLLYATQHGRDNLFQSFPSMFTAQDGAENPAEELFQVNQGDDFGWPYCYYDFRAGHRVLAPEYGGNRSTIGRCAGTKAALTAFPGHWAPNGLVFYGGSSFPARYRNGAFVAFHGSWNRAPQPQAGYLIAFVPASGNTLGSTYEIFADNLAGGTISNESQAAHRPTGLAVDPSGALFITDDYRGRIWRVVYRGP